MNASELLDTLIQQGVQVRLVDNKLSIRSPKGVLTPDLKASLTTQKSDLLSLLKAQKAAAETATHEVLEQGFSLRTLGRLLGGFGKTLTAEYRDPVISPAVMAKQLEVTFRPLPKHYKHEEIIQFRERLKQQLQDYGVTIRAWEQATRDFRYEIKLPGLARKLSIKTRLIKPDINAVIDVERPLTVRRISEGFVAEKIYQTYRRFFQKEKSISIASIGKIISWAEEHVAKYIENPTNTQVIVLTELNREFVDPNLSYQRKIAIGINTLIRTFSELVIGVSKTQFSILNMNLSDSVFASEELDTFVAKSLVPKVFVPILPLPLSRFDITQYDPTTSHYAAKLVALGQALADTGLFPPGFKLSQVIQRQSYRDIVDNIVNGRTGVSYGFVAYAEEPQYVGPVEIDAKVWADLSPVEGFSPDEIRQNYLGRRYLSLQIGDNQRFKQLPDVWLMSSRSGANKTDLNLEQDVLRIGLTTQLLLQTPAGSTLSAADIKPSYDIYVMVGIALAVALYTPELAQGGFPIIHFHGYPAANWFEAHESWQGVQNPSVPCGTYESGVFNFLSISRLVNQHGSDIKLAALIEPDHGTNILATDLTYLLERVKAGCQRGEIALGGKHFKTLKSDKAAEQGISLTTARSTL